MQAFVKSNEYLRLSGPNHQIAADEPIDVCKKCTLAKTLQIILWGDHLKYICRFTDQSLCPVVLRWLPQPGLSSEVREELHTCSTHRPSPWA